jgi:preprotein translocase subunit SecG
MTTLLTIFHVLICLFLIAVVLLQSGRAGGMGVLSGAATQTVFGGRGAGSFLQKLTAVCAILFMLTCSTLAWMASSTRDRSLRNAPAAPTSSTRAVGTARPAGGAGGAQPAPASAPAPANESTPTPGAAAPAPTTPAPATPAPTSP